MKNLYKIGDDLYIVSSSEKIKENTQTRIEGLNGDWFYNTIYNFIARTGDITSYDFKIILTTNKLLIKDGVQAIDNEFLEWFVKNPSCEEVEVKMNQGRYFDYGGNVHITNAYKIIIPKEEPKLKNICIKCGVDLYATEGRFECQKHPKECKGIYLSKETLLIHAAEQKQHLIDMIKADEELGLYKEPKFVTVNMESATGEDLGRVSYVPIPNVDYIPKQEKLEEVGTYQQELFNYLANELDVFALQGQMHDIESIVLNMQQENSCEHNYILTAEQGHRIIKCLKCNNIQPI